MLYLRRRHGERIVIQGPDFEIEIEVREYEDYMVLGVDAPLSMRVDRKEVVVGRHYRQLQQAQKELAALEFAD